MGRVFPIPFISSVVCFLIFPKTELCTFKINIPNQLLMPLVNHCAFVSTSASIVLEDISKWEEKYITINLYQFLQNTSLGSVICDLGTSLSQIFSSTMITSRSPCWIFLPQICDCFSGPSNPSACHGQPFSTSLSHIHFHVHCVEGSLLSHLNLQFSVSPWCPLFLYWKES